LRGCTPPFDSCENPIVPKEVAMSRLSRRRLLQGATGLAAGCWASRYFEEHGHYPSVQADEPPAVVVAEGTNDDTPGMFIRAALAPYGGIGRFVKPGQT